MTETTLLTNATRPASVHAANQDVVHFASLLAMPVPVPPRPVVAAPLFAHPVRLALVIVALVIAAVATGLLWGYLDIIGVTA